MATLRLKTHTARRHLRAGMILLACVTLFAVSFSFFHSVFRPRFHDFEGSDSLTQFWDEAHLTSDDLAPLFRSSDCQIDHDHLLACRYSLALMALSEGLEWNPRAQGFQKIESLYPQISWTEKEWLEQLENVALEPQVGWSKLLTMKPMRSETVGLGFNAYFGVTIDPHSYLFPYHAYENSFFKSTQQLSGQFAYLPDGIHLKNTFAHTIFSERGISENARLEKVDGIDANTFTLSKLQEKLSSLGTKSVSLKFEGQPSLPLREDDLLIEHVRSFPVREERGEVAVVEIHKFVNNTCNLVRAELKSHARAVGFILDLRGNPGGQVDEALCVARLFLQNGKKIYEMKDLRGNFIEAQYSTRAGIVTSTPLAILVDNGTASSAEIVAGSLKDLGRATIVGERTFGKGTFQDGRVWEKNEKILFFKTTGFYYFSSGLTPQIVGLQADFEVPVLEKNMSANQRREETAFLSPLRPFDLWSGAQDLNLERHLTLGEDCDSSGSVQTASMSDLFIRRAQAALSCAPKLKNHFSGRL